MNKIAILIISFLLINNVAAFVDSDWVKTDQQYKNLYDQKIAKELNSIEFQYIDKRIEKGRIYVKNKMSEMNFYRAIVNNTAASDKIKPEYKKAYAEFYKFSQLTDKMRSLEEWIQQAKVYNQNANYYAADRIIVARIFVHLNYMDEAINIETRDSELEQKIKAQSGIIFEKVIAENNKEIELSKQNISPAEKEIENQRLAKEKKKISDQLFASQQQYFRLLGAISVYSEYGITPAKSWHEPLLKRIEEYNLVEKTQDNKNYLFGKNEAIKAINWNKQMKKEFASSILAENTFIQLQKLDFERKSLKEKFDKMK
jgi:hypothetical protein